MLRRDVLVFAVVLVAFCGHGGCTDLAPEDEWTHAMFQRLGNNAGLVVKEFSKAAPGHELELHNILARITNPASINGTDYDDSAGCIGCQLIVTILTYLIKMGYDMNDFQGPAEQICELLFLALNGLIPLKPMPGEKVCPGIIANFGHHVEAVFRYSRFLPEESCYLIRTCRNDLPSFELPPLIDFVASVRAPRRWALPEKEVHNYRTKRRVKVQRDWHTDEDILRVAQLTDAHVDEYYAEGAPTSCGMPLCCRELPADWDPMSGSAGPYGDYACNVPPETTLMFLDKAKELNPDIVLYSGDSPPHHLWEETLDGQLNATYWVAQQLADHFPDVTGIYSTIGNHECFPSNLYYPDHEDTQALHDTFIGSYQELSNFTEEQLATINRGGYYTVKISDGLRLVAPNGNLGYSNNWYNLLLWNEGLLEEMFTWLDNTLAQARAAGEKVLVMTHHPVHESMISFDETFSAYMLEYADIITLHTVGHKHKDEFRVFRDDSGTGRGVQFLSQSSNSYSSSNPGVRMFYLDKTTFDVLGYEQYYLDITDLTGPAEVKLLYKTDDDYSLADLSADSMLDFAARMEEDDALFDQFYLNRASGANTQPACDEACKKRTLCRLTTSTDDDEDKCVDGTAAVTTAEPGQPVQTTQPSGGWNQTEPDIDPPTQPAQPTVEEPEPTSAAPTTFDLSFAYVISFMLLYMAF